VVKTKVETYNLDHVLVILCFALPQVMCAYWGIGLHLGVAIPQNQKGHLIGHVKVCNITP
jgi:hypothetical protein